MLHLFICILNKPLLHCIALHCIALHCIALHCIALHCIALHCIVLSSPPPHPHSRYPVVGYEFLYTSMGKIDNEQSVVFLWDCGEGKQLRRASQSCRPRGDATPRGKRLSRSLACFTPPLTQKKNKRLLIGNKETCFSSPLKVSSIYQNPVSPQKLVRRHFHFQF